MKPVIPTLAAVAAGMALAMALVVAVEAFGEMVHPGAPGSTAKAIAIAVLNQAAAAPRLPSGWF